MYAYFRFPSIGIDQKFLAQRHRSRDIAFGAPTGIKIPASLHTSRARSLPSRYHRIEFFASYVGYAKEGGIGWVVEEAGF